MENTTPVKGTKDPNGVKEVFNMNPFVDLSDTNQI